MIKRLQADHFPGDLGIVALQVMQQVGLSRSRPDDEDLAGVPHGLRHAVEIVLVGGSMARVAKAGLVMEVARLFVRPHRPFIGALPADRVDAGLGVVDPYGDTIHARVHG
jgi:hypothetical protein